MIISIADCHLQVEYDYQPEERATAHYPGCDEEVVITDISLSNVSLVQFIHRIYPEILEDIEEQILERLHDKERNL